jgi:hypothetical protein
MFTIHKIRCLYEENVPFDGKPLVPVFIGIFQIKCQEKQKQGKDNSGSPLGQISRQDFKSVHHPCLAPSLLQAI